MKKILITLMILISQIFSQDVFLYISDVTIYGTIDIYMINTEDVFGFQINIEDSELNDADYVTYGSVSGGSADDAGFIVSSNSEGLLLGFSLTGSFIPAGEGVFVYRQKPLDKCRINIKRDFGLNLT